MVSKKAVYNGLSLNVYTPFDFQLQTKPVPLSFLILMYQMLADTQTYFEVHHR